MTDPYTIYLAGDWFDHKHLIGNAILASYIESVSQGQYTCLVPQDLEQPTGRGVDIRNNDLRGVMECDLGIFNFDGADLDSGTVAEFMYAKLLDIPAVLLRSDLRSRGDSDRDPWNLMCSYYPRTEIVQFNGMAWYKEATAASTSLAQATESLYTRIAVTLINASRGHVGSHRYPKAVGLTLSGSIAGRSVFQAAGWRHGPSNPILWPRF